MCDEEVLDELRKAIAQGENLVSSTIEYDANPKNGVGIGGVISRFKIRGFTGDCTEKIVSLILKRAPVQELVRKSLPVSKMYEDEIYAYTKVLPAFETLKKSPGDSIRTPICYATGSAEGEEYLILEDLNAEGYRHFNPAAVMDDRHIFLILEACAKLHAKSLVMKARRPKLWKELLKGINHVSSSFFGKSGACDAIIDYARLLDAIFDPVTEKEIAEKFFNFREGELKKFMVEICCGEDPDFVLAHGDLWGNNILFKYQNNLDSECPTGVSLIDWQALRISSVAVDLSYFFYMCAGKKAMDNVEEYLKYYYQKLCENVQVHGVNPDSVFPVETFDEQWRKYNKFGFTMCLVVLHAVTCEAGEFPTYEDVEKSGLSFWEALHFISKNQHVYHARVKDVIVHFVEKNYL